jgi:hypothetical protein
LLIRLEFRNEMRVLMLTILPEAAVEPPDNDESRGYNRC